MCKGHKIGFERSRAEVTQLQSVTGTQNISSHDGPIEQKDSYRKTQGLNHCHFAYRTLANFAGVAQEAAPQSRYDVVQAPSQQPQSVASASKIYGTCGISSEAVTTLLHAMKNSRLMEMDACILGRDYS